MKKIIFDVGAYDAGNGLSLCINEDYILYAFEAHPERAKAIENIFNGNPNFYLINKAVSENNGVANFNFCKFGGASSLCNFKNENELKIWWKERTDLHYSGQTIEIETIRLDTFIEQNNIDRIDYLHIDTQGSDLDVLKSLGKYIDIVEEGNCEVARTKDTAIYTNQTAILDDVLIWLEKNNFTIQSIKQNDPDYNEMMIYYKRKK